jgi:S1-C subfamily serine protease
MKKVLSAVAVFTLFLSWVASAQHVLTNKDILDMVKAKLSDAVIVDEIRKSPCKFSTAPDDLIALKQAGVSDAVIAAMTDLGVTTTQPAARPAQGRRPPARLVDRLTGEFEHLQNSVVTVWSEIGHGTGFIIDPRGIILTNQHVIGPSTLLSVQFGPHTKVATTLLAADPEKDIAVLWANLAPMPAAIAAPLAVRQNGQPVVEGEEVFTIGSPLSQQKIITRGIVSKVEPGAIISDVDINPGNSGGPLFNSLGEVVGITTFHQGSVGAGLSGIIRIEDAEPLISEAEKKMSALEEPAPNLLPVEPDEPFPLSAIKAALREKKFSVHPYVFAAGGYVVCVTTPILKYWMEQAGSVAAARQHERRVAKGRGAVTGTFQPLGDLKNWEEYTGEYKAVTFVLVMPRAGVTWGSLLKPGPKKMVFKTDFYRMKLMCGQKEVQPIQPSKIADVVNTRHGSLVFSDATYWGFYEYPPDSISPECGSVKLKIYSEKNPNKPTVRTLDKRTVQHVWADFEPYRMVDHAAIH